MYCCCVINFDHSGVYRFRSSTTKKSQEEAGCEKGRNHCLPAFMVKSKSVSTTKLSSALKSAEKIDKLVEANYSKYKVKPNPMTTDEQFLRRIYLDITGTIPTYRENTLFFGFSSSGPNVKT